MKNFLIGIILFVVIIIGGAIALSFMDVNVPTKEIVIEIPTATSAPTPAPETIQQTLPQGQ